MSNEQTGGEIVQASLFSLIYLRVAATLLILCIPLAALGQQPTVTAVTTQTVTTDADGVADPGIATETDEQRQERLSIERFVEILLKRPRPGTALDRVFAYHLAHGSVDEFSKLLAQRFSDSHDGNIALLLGLIDKQRGEDEAAIHWLRQAEELLVATPLPSFFLGQCFAIVGQPVEAISAFERAIGKKPTKPDALLIFKELGRSYQRAGQIEEAVNIWKQLEQLFPNDLQIPQQIAEILVEEGDLSGAIVRYERLANLSTKDLQQIEMRWRSAKLKLKIIFLAGVNDQPSQATRIEAQQELLQLLGKVNPDSWLFESMRDDIDRSYLEVRDFTGLVAYYTQWVTEKPDDTDAMLRLARHLSIADTAQAKQWVAKASDRAPKLAAAHLLMVDLLEREFDFAGAAAKMKQVVALEPSNIDAIQRWGELVARDGTLDKVERRSQAIEIWNRLLTVGRRDAVGLVRTAELLRSVDAESEAIVLYWEAIALAGDEPQYREYLGEYLFRQGHVEEAIATWREMASGERATRNNLIRLSEVFRSFKLEKESLDSMRSACEMQPTFAQRVKFSSLLRDAKMHADAIAQLDLADLMVADTDEQLISWTERIYCYIESRELPERIGLLEARCKDFYRDSGDAWMLLALMQEAANRMPAAANSIDVALRLSAESIVAHDAAARIYQRANRLDDALAMLKRLQIIDTRGRSTYLMQISQLHERLGKVDDALAVAREIVASIGANSEQYLYYANLCFRAKKPDLGLAALRRSLRLHPLDRTTLLTLAQRLFENSKHDEAFAMGWRALVDTSDQEDLRPVMDVLARLYLQSRRVPEFRSQLMELSTRGFRRRTLTLATAHGFQLIGDIVQARQTLASLLSGTDEDTELLTELIRLSEREADFAAAVEFQKRLNQFDASEAGKVTLAKLEMLAGKTEESLRRLEELESEQSGPSNYIELTNDLLKRNLLEVAVKVSRVGVEKFPADWELLSTALLVNWRAMEQAAAVDFADAILELNRPFEQPSRKVAQSMNASAPESGAARGNTPEASGLRFSAPGTPRGRDPLSRHAWLQRSHSIQSSLFTGSQSLRGTPSQAQLQTLAQQQQQAKLRLDLLQHALNQQLNSTQPVTSNPAVAASPLVLSNLGPTTPNAFRIYSPLTLYCYGDARALALMCKLMAESTASAVRTEVVLKQAEHAISMQSKDDLWDCAMLLEMQTSASTTGRTVLTNSGGQITIISSSSQIAITPSSSRISSSSTSGQTILSTSRGTFLGPQTATEKMSAQVLSALVDQGDSEAVAIALSRLRERFQAESELATLKYSTSAGLSSQAPSAEELAQFRKLVEKQEQLRGAPNFDDLIGLAGAYLRAGQRYAGEDFLNSALKIGASEAELLRAAERFKYFSGDIVGRILSVAIEKNLHAGNSPAIEQAIVRFFQLKDSFTNENSSKLVEKLMDHQAKVISGLSEDQFSLLTPSPYVNNLLLQRTKREIIEGDFLSGSPLFTSTLLLAVQSIYRNPRHGEVSKWLREFAEQEGADQHQRAIRFCCLAAWEWRLNNRSEALDAIRAVRKTGVAPAVVDLYEAQILLYSDQPREALDVIARIPSDANDEDLLSEREIVAFCAATRLKEPDRAAKAIDNLLGYRLSPQTQLEIAKAILPLGMKDQAMQLLQRVRKQIELTMYVPLLELYIANDMSSESVELAYEMLTNIPPRGKADPLASVRTASQAARIAQLRGQNPAMQALDFPGYDGTIARTKAIEVLKKHHEIHAAIERFEFAATNKSPAVIATLEELYRADGNAYKADEYALDLQTNSTQNAQTLMQLARDWSSSQKHGIAINAYIRALKAQPSYLSELNSFRRSLIEGDRHPEFCKELLSMGVGKFSSDRIMLHSVGRELMRKGDKATLAVWVAGLVEQYGISALDSTYQYYPVPRDERFDFMDDKLATTIATKAIEFCLTSKNQNLNDPGELQATGGGWDLVCAAISRDEAAKRRVLDQLRTEEVEQRTEATTLVVTILSAADQTDVELEKGLDELFGDSRYAEKLGRQAIWDACLQVSIDSNRRAVVMRSLETAHATANRSGSGAEQKLLTELLHLMKQSQP